MKKYSLLWWWLVQVSRLVLVALFIFTAVAKLFVVSTFAGNVAELLSSSGLDYERWTWPATVAVISVEFLIVILLVVPRTVRTGAVAAAVLLMGFAGYALYYVYVLNGEPLECGCFGRIIGSQLGVNTALRNLALLIPAGLIFFGYARVRNQSVFNPATDQATA
ncbi:MAG TPA: MauE/DoxX family redox-associated membrane protein [Pyrinomonadaceae bacterium]|nr:MauE/DoxX family redox-associated membrane protein [Pyrinomonadaceae bacterium]